MKGSNSVLCPVLAPCLPLPCRSVVRLVAVFGWCLGSLRSRTFRLLFTRFHGPHQLSLPGRAARCYALWPLFLREVLTRAFLPLA